MLETIQKANNNLDWILIAILDPKSFMLATHKIYFMSNISSNCGMWNSI